MMCRLDSLIALRDLGDNYNNVDTLYILAVPGKEFDLERLAKNWGADLVCIMGDERSQDLLGTSEKCKVLECWWD